MMKKMCKYALLAGMVAIPASAMQAQGVWSVERGDTLLLESAEGYSSYQWQVSSDLNHFADIPGGNVQNYPLRVNAPGFYRVKVIDAGQRVLYLDTLDVALNKVAYSDNFSISGGGHGYVETVDGRPWAEGINIPEDRVDGVAGTSKKLTSWVNGNAMAVYYLNHPAAIVDSEMYLTVKKGACVTFRVKVFDPENLGQSVAENMVAIKGTGCEQHVPLVAAAFSRKTYYRYQIECLEGWNSILEISKFHHYSPSETATYKSAFRSSPSVHLGGWRSTAPGAHAPKENAYDWCYQEVMIPKESDIIGTYAMSLGVLSGYMGIQVNGYDEKGPIHGVLFSMWDDGSTDEDPNLPDYRRAKALDSGKDVIVKRFGNEGTGVQTFKRGRTWECDTYVQFITNCRTENAVYYKDVNGERVEMHQRNMLVSAWYNAQDGKGWQYMATLRLPNKNKFFGSWYSFLENFNAATGQAERKAFYRNGYARSRRAHSWFHCNSVNFGHTDGGSKTGARNDFSQGVSEEEKGAFFMATGGYLDSHLTSKVMPLNTEHTAVDTINLVALEKRVDQAIAHEKKLIEQEELFDQNKIKKDKWQMIDFSSQELKGEGTNGRAAQTIDGDVKTYWHTQWQGERAHYPHYLTVDMNELYEINGMEIFMSGGSRRHIKAFNLYVSDDGKAWKKVYGEEDAPDKENFRFLLNEAVVSRYFKLEITDGRAKDGDHIRINEIEVSGVPVQTGISEVVSDDEVDVLCRKNEISVSFREMLTDVCVELYAADGLCLFSRRFAELDKNETLHIPMTHISKGVYVLSCRTGKKNYVKSVLWKN